jgi:acyl-CoA synthetase (AMP-forming)/AMP-acid ligase II
LYITDGPVIGAASNELSYREVEHWVATAAGKLASLGVQKGDPVMIWLPNGLEYVLLSLACYRLGAVFVPVNSQSKPVEVEKLAAIAEPKLTITEQPLALGRRSIVLRDFWAIAAAPVPASARRVFQGSDTVAVIFTSGSTGVPKGARLRHAGLAKYAAISAGLASLVPTWGPHCMFAALPMNHVMGYDIALSAIPVGVPLVLHRHFDPVRAVEAFARHHVTVFLGVPPMYRMIDSAGLLETADLSSIWMFVSAADVLPNDVADRFRAAVRRNHPFSFPFRPAFLELYGQTETSGIVSARFEIPGVTFESGCVGWPVPGVKTRLVDPETGQPVRGKGPGILQVRGQNVMAGYLKDAELKSGDWLTTGDLMRRGKYGMLYFVERENLRIKTGGYSVFPQEVERELEHHPNIREVCVVGRKDSKKGEVPVAAVVLRDPSADDAAGLLAWARERMAPYKAPREIRIVESLPRSHTGKFLRREIENLFE